MTATDITRALWSKFVSHKYKFANVYFFSNESDFLTFTTTGYTYDFEIKISRSDYLADFNKPRHKIFENLLQGKDYVVIKGHTWKWKHKPQYTSITIDKMETRVGNRFYFVVPYGLIGKDEVPDYAGLIYVQENNIDTCLKIKEAPLLHKHKHDPKRRFQMLYNLYESSMINKLF